MKEKFLKGLNLFLTLNLFFVLFSFLWLAAAVLAKSAQFDLGLDLWMSLWMSVFQPSIGILMAGALVSGLSSWVTKKLADRQDQKTGGLL
jgi:TRAP-type C4-dicarboxylate transport system permease small subunit